MNDINNISHLLDSSMSELNINPYSIELSNHLNIVEFLQKYTTLPNQNIYDLGVKLADSCPMVSITEALPSALSRINNSTAAKPASSNIQGQATSAAPRGLWNNIKSAVKQGVGNPSTGNASQPTSNLFKMMGNALNTNGAVIRNAPMFSVVGADHTTQYYAFPDLDMKRPGHQEIFNSLMAAQKGTLVPYDSGDRKAASSRTTNIKFPDELINSNSKQALMKALAGLQQTITSEQQKLKAYGFISPEEFELFKTEIGKHVGGISQATAAAEQEGSTQAVVAELGQEIQQTPPAAGGATPAPANPSASGNIMGNAYDRNTSPATTVANPGAAAAANKPPPPAPVAGTAHAPTQPTDATKAEASAVTHKLPVAGEPSVASPGEVENTAPVVVGDNATTQPTAATIAASAPTQPLSVKPPTTGVGVPVQAAGPVAGPSKPNLGLGMANDGNPTQVATNQPSAASAPTQPTAATIAASAPTQPVPGHFPGASATTQKIQQHVKKAPVRPPAANVQPMANRMSVQSGQRALAASYDPTTDPNFEQSLSEANKALEETLLELDITFDSDTLN